MVCQKKTSNLLDIHLVFDFRVLRVLETVLEPNIEQSVYHVFVGLTHIRVCVSMNEQNCRFS